MAPITPKKSLVKSGSSKKTLPSSASPLSKKGSASKVKVEFRDASPSPSPSSSRKKIDVSGRAKTRDLVRWTVEKDIKVLLSIHELCKIKKINLPYDEIAKQVADHCTGNALGQHLDKLYKKTLEDNPDNAPIFEGSRTGTRMRKAMVSYTSGRKRSHKPKQYEVTPDSDEDPDEGDPDDSFGEKITPSKGKHKKGKRVKEEDSSSDEFSMKSTPKKKKKLTKAKEHRKFKTESDSEDEKYEKPSLSDKGDDNDSDIGEGYVGAGSSLLPYNSKLDKEDSTEVAESKADRDDGADGVNSAEEEKGKGKDVHLSKQIVIALPPRLLATLFISPRAEPVPTDVVSIHSELPRVTPATVAPATVAPAAFHPGTVNSTMVNPTHVTSAPIASVQTGPPSMINFSSVPGNSNGGIDYLGTDDLFSWPPLLGTDDTYIDWTNDMFENDPMIAGSSAKFGEDDEKDFFGL